MKLTESELRNMIYEEVLNTLDELEEEQSAWQKIKGAAKNVVKKAGEVASNAGRNIAASKTHQNSQIQNHFLGRMYGNKNKEQEKQLAQNKQAQQKIQESTDDVANDINNMGDIVPPQVAVMPEIKELMGNLQTNFTSGNISTARGDADTLVVKLNKIAAQTKEPKLKYDLIKARDYIHTIHAKLPSNPAVDNRPQITSKM